MLPKLLLAIAALTTVACASDAKPSPATEAGGGRIGSGGASTGGVIGSGGAVGIGGAGGANGEGGAVSAGGRVGSLGGASTGGGVAAGGTVGAGGRVGSLGGASAGGSVSAGGRAAPLGGTSAGGGSAKGGTGSSGATAACGECSAYVAAVQSGSVEPSALAALSGLAVSRSQPDIFFAHNDHQEVLVFALDMQGRERARLVGEGTTATDIEDIAVGPCGTQTCVYLGDIGDNNAQRSEYAVLRFVAPTIPTGTGSPMLTVSVERFRFTYEDGSHNAEALMVGPDGTVYVVTKLAPGSGGNVPANGPSSIFRLPTSLATTSVARATKVVTLSVPRTGEGAASAAAAHPCGTAFLLRTYDRVFEFVAPAGAGFEAAFSATPREIAMNAEPQSEGIDYLAQGQGFVTSGEGSRAPIYRTVCAP